MNNKTKWLILIIVSLSLGLLYGRYGIYYLSSVDTEHNDCRGFFGSWLAGNITPLSFEILYWGIFGGALLISIIIAAIFRHRKEIWMIPCGIAAFMASTYLMLCVRQVIPASGYKDNTALYASLPLQPWNGDKGKAKGTIDPFGNIKIESNGAYASFFDNKTHTRKFISVNIEDAVYKISIYGLNGDCQEVNEYKVAEAGSKTAVTLKDFLAGKYDASIDCDYFCNTEGFFSNLKLEPPKTTHAVAASEESAAAEVAEAPEDDSHEHIGQRNAVPIQEWMQCTSCFGTGRCSWCNGQGVLYDYNGERDCPTCIDGRCGICAGQGGHYETQYR